MDFPTDILFEIEQRVTHAFAWYNLVLSCQLFRQERCSDENKRRFSRIVRMDNEDDGYTLCTILPNGTPHEPSSTCVYSGMDYSWFNQGELYKSMSVVDSTGMLYKLHCEGKIPADDIIHTHQILGTHLKFMQPETGTLREVSSEYIGRNLHHVILDGKLVFMWDENGNLIYQGSFCGLGTELLNRILP